MQREKWGTQLGFIMAAAGSAIGLGTLWKFPYVTGENGGGLFVLMYILCTFFIGIPVFIAELIIGRKAQRGAVGTFSQLHREGGIWKLAGWLGVFSSFLIMSFYSVVAGWGLNYALMSLNQFYLNKTPKEIEGVFDILVKSGDITLFWHLIFTGMVVAFVLPGIRQGVEYWSKRMTSALLIIILVLFCFALSLDGFSEGLRFVLYPELITFKPSSILEALGLSFFTLSLGQGIMITYGSYMRQTDDIPKTAIIIGIVVPIIAILTALMIFPIIFTYGGSPQGGPGLVFKTLPLIFSKLPGALLLSTSFFVLFVFTAITSAIAFVEVIVANFIDLYGWSRRKAVLAVGLGCFIFGIPSALSGSQGIFANWEQIYGRDFFSTVDHLVSAWILPLGGLMVALFSGWVLDANIMKAEFSSNTVFMWLWKPWRFLLRWVAPIGIFLIMLQQGGIINLDALIKRIQ